MRNAVANAHAVGYSSTFTHTYGHSLSYSATFTHTFTHTYGYSSSYADAFTYTYAPYRPERAWLQSARPADGGPVLEWGDLG